MKKETKLPIHLKGQCRKFFSDLMFLFVDMIHLCSGLLSLYQYQLIEFSKVIGNVDTCELSRTAGVFTSASVVSIVNL
jgi:hypothetical protein